MKVELIPVIEIGFEEEESYFIQPTPNNSYWLNSKKWEQYFTEKIKKNGYENYTSIKEGYPFYRINQFTSKKDLLKIIQFHLGGAKEKTRIPLNKSCALFGGYVLVIDEQIVFTPQCCSTLSDILTWQSIIKDEFKEGYICLEGHPCPKVMSIEDTLQFTFEDKWEDFIPPAITSIVDKQAMTHAIEKCQLELDEFGKRLNSLSEILNQKEIAELLIYTKA